MNTPNRGSTGLAPFLAIVLCSTSDVLAQVPAELRPWLEDAQNWTRDTDGPVLSLGAEGAFDDTHVFAPLVARERGRFTMWYCGSTGRVAERVFHLGRATSDDGKHFERSASNPTARFGDGRHSILTPCLLRDTDGRPIRENGRLRTWFSSTWFAGGKGRHTLHEMTSADGASWSKPSAELLEDVYAPCVLKVGDRYRMWFVDVGNEPWSIRHATSPDGRTWTVGEKPCLEVAGGWESGRLFYPTVLRVNGVYLMWYGSYWTERRSTTALGFAASLDGETWFRHPRNPVFVPAPDRPWESHYVTSQSVMRLPDGSLRMWYASRRKPPFVNKYFAINTATWKIGPKGSAPTPEAIEDPR